MLFCLERVSAIRKLDLVHCRVLPEGMEFVLSATHKWGSSDQLTKAFFARFPCNSRLCLVETSGSYLKATRAIRPVFPLFQGGSVVYSISYAKPHKPIMAPSIKRWLLYVCYSGFLVSTSKTLSSNARCTAARRILCVEPQLLQQPIPMFPYSEILRMAYWSTPSTFQRFYFELVLFRTVLQ